VLIVFGCAAPLARTPLIFLFRRPGWARLGEPPQPALVIKG
jgi:hypothetical protein